jgi:hypothetical protein
MHVPLMNGVLETMPTEGVAALVRTDFSCG